MHVVKFQWNAVTLICDRFFFLFVRFLCRILRISIFRFLWLSSTRDVSRVSPHYFRLLFYYYYYPSLSARTHHYARSWAHLTSECDGLKIADCIRRCNLASLNLFVVKKTAADSGKKTIAPNGFVIGGRK